MTSQGWACETHHHQHPTTTTTHGNKMLLFCPQCSNTLTVSRSLVTGTNRLECRTCPYEFILTRKYFERKAMKRKEVDDVMGGEGAWDNVDQTEVMCPIDACEGQRGYFYMVQIRSADEPMTTFYKARRPLPTRALLLTMPSVCSVLSAVTNGGRGDVNCCELPGMT